MRLRRRRARSPGRSERARAEAPAAPPECSERAREPPGHAPAASAAAIHGQPPPGLPAPRGSPARAARRDHALASAHATGARPPGPDFFSRVELAARGQGQPAAPLASALPMAVGFAC